MRDVLLGWSFDTRIKVHTTSTSVFGSCMGAVLSLNLWAMSAALKLSQNASNLFRAALKKWKRFAFARPTFRSIALSGVVLSIAAGYFNW